MWTIALYEPYQDPMYQGLIAYGFTVRTPLGIYGGRLRVGYGIDPATVTPDFRRDYALRTARKWYYKWRRTK